MLDIAALTRRKVNHEIQVTLGDLSSETLNLLKGAGVVACDTETTGLDWRRDELGTVQFYADSCGTIVVQRPGVESRRLAELISDEGVAKIFHHAPFDLRFLRHAVGIQSRNVWCTKVAAKLLAESSGDTDNSLAGLLLREFGLRLNKGSVRTSNWAAGELSMEQLAYAAQDVTYLLPLLGSLIAQLSRRGDLELYEHCCAHLPWRTELDVSGIGDVYAY